jgi:predicted outer membrane repeat protein
MKIKGPHFPDYVSPRAIVQTPASPASDNVSITFTLMSNDDAPASVTVSYSKNGGGTFSPCTLDSSTTTGLATAAYPGTSHSVTWNSVADGIGLSGSENVIIKVDAGGTPGTSGAFAVINTDHNSPPSATVTTPSGEKFGNIRIDYTLLDAESNNCSVIAYYSANNGANWTAATMAGAGDGTVNLSASPSGTAHVFYWDSRADNIAMNASNSQVKFRISPFDAFHQGISGDTNAFTVNNTITNMPPTVTITSGPANGSMITTRDVTFTWTGSDNDGTITGYYYSLDHDPPDIWTTSTTHQYSNLLNAEHTFRVIAMDNSSALSLIAMRTFTVNYTNVPPTVTITGGPSGTTTDNTPTFTYAGSDSDGTIAGYYVSIDLNPPNIWTTQTSYTPAPLTDGGHTFYVKSRDDSGDNSSVSSRLFTVDTTPANGTTIYVDGTSGDNTNNGLSWATAVRTIQRGLDLAGNNDIVLVADGTYAGDGNKNLDFSGKKICLKSNGGYQNCIINMEVTGRGVKLDNSEGPGTRIEGFSFLNGKPMGTGPFPTENGGAILCYGASGIEIAGCFFENNAATGGGGVGCITSSARIENCVFKNNNGTWNGCGVMGRAGSNMEIVNCTFDNNVNSVWGGATTVLFSSAAFENCVFTNNKAQNDGGALYAWNASITIDNCLLDQNGAGGSSYGGGVYAYNSTVEITNSGVIGNYAAFYGGCYFEKSDAYVANTDVKRNYITSSGYGGGLIFKNTRLLIENCTFDSNNSTSAGGAGIYCDDNSTGSIRNCIISNNRTSSGGAGAEVSDYSAVDFVGCIFENNSGNGVGGDHGGAIYIMQNAASAITNCIIKNNTMETGAGIYFGQFTNATVANCLLYGNLTNQAGGGAIFSEGNLSIINSTITGNTAQNGDGGGLWFASEARVKIYNSVIWGNNATGAGKEIHLSSWMGKYPELIMEYCDLADNSIDPNNVHVDGTFVQNNCMASYPDFENSAGYDFHLSASSPCVDAGNNSYATGSTDLDGNPRIIDGDNDSIATVDIGAYEYQVPPPDYITNSIGMQFKLIPAGNFLMGSWDNDTNAGSDEKPKHTVNITQRFYMGVYEVTQKQWFDVMGTHPSNFSGDNNPVEHVSWNDIQTFISTLNALENTNIYRLLTEAEWEYSCRAGTNTIYHFGESSVQLDNYAWYNGNSGSTTHAVGTKLPNAWGLYDMYGNVWEACQDWYSESYYSTSPANDPSGPTGPLSTRVYRGGCYNNLGSDCRSAHRGIGIPDYLYGGTCGFRVCRSSGQ